MTDFEPGQLSRYTGWTTGVQFPERAMIW